MSHLFDNQHVTNKVLSKAMVHFNDNIGNWNTSGVTDMKSMFFMALAFNQPIGKWNTNNVKSMHSMFYGSLFNHPLNSWNTSSVTDMNKIFDYATYFNQDLSSWRPAITDKDSVNGFPCYSPLQHKSDFWPKSTSTTNFFTKAYFKCPKE